MGDNMQGRDGVDIYSYNGRGRRNTGRPYRRSAHHQAGSRTSWGVDAEKQNTNYRSWQAGNHRNDEETMQVPKCMVRRIIGRGGSMITELERRSSCRIKINRESFGDTVDIRLLGDSAGRTMASNLIQQMVDEFMTPAVSPQPIPNADPEESTHELQETEISDAPIDWQKLAEEHMRTRGDKWKQFPPIIKNFYAEDPDIKAMSEEEVENFRDTNNHIMVARVLSEEECPKPIPNPVATFEQCFSQWPEILVELDKMGFVKPSPIQAQGWPVLLSGQDLIGIAQTGTGKTLAYLLPALIHTDGQTLPRAKRLGPTVLVLAPTRELALQIEKEVNKYSYRGIKAVCVYGGANRREQIELLSAKVEIVIATPGRLNDLVQCGHLNVSSVSYLILDEADRMLDMGFEPQIRKVMLDIRPDRQTVMTSATWPPGVKRLALSYMEDPVQVYVGSMDLTAVHSVTQTIYVMRDDEEEKFRTLINWTQTMKPEHKVIIFCSKKARADNIASELVVLGYDCTSLHGDREQVDREQALKDITLGTVQILVATDLASRGLDIQDVTHVINYDFPRELDEYVHRIGRTGRAGRTGQAISYFTNSDWMNAKRLITILEEAQQYVPEQLRHIAEDYEVRRARSGPWRGRGGRGGSYRGRRW